MRQRTLDFPEVMLARLEAEAQRRGVKVTELVRRLIDQGLDAVGAPFPESTGPAPAQHRNEYEQKAPAQHRPGTGPAPDEGGKGGVLNLGGGSSRSEDVSAPKGEVQEGGQPSTKRRRRPANSAPPDDPDFETFYAHYPRHEARKDAVKAWGQTSRDRPPLDELLAALSRQVRTNDWSGERLRFCPLPASWLRGHRWGDSPPGDVLPFAAPPKPVDPWILAVVEMYPPGEKRDAALAKIGRPLEPHEELAIANYRKAAR